MCVFVIAVCEVENIIVSSVYVRLNENVFGVYV